MGILLLLYAKICHWLEQTWKSLVIVENAPQSPALGSMLESHGLVGLVYCPDVACDDRAGLE